MSIEVCFESGFCPECNVGLGNVEHMGDFLAFEYYLTIEYASRRIEVDPYGDTYYQIEDIEILRKNLLLAKFTTLAQAKERWISGSMRVVDSDGEEMTPIIYYAEKKSVVEKVEELLVFVELALMRRESILFYGD